MLEYRVVQCPYCRHTQPVLVDRLASGPGKVEWCRVCGRPMLVQTLIVTETLIRITVRRGEE